MIYFLDTEFIESGPHQPIDLLSIGIVCEDGREFYMESSEADTTKANDWVKANVLPHLVGPPVAQPLAVIKNTIVEFCARDHKPEFWGYYADYDWICFAQIFGRMIDLPKGWPMFCHDLKQMAMELGNPKLPKQDSTEHNALNDALWNKTAYEFLARHTVYYRIAGVDSGVGMIIDERLRQIREEGFSPEHDDGHVIGELSEAAACYARHASKQVCGIASTLGIPMYWMFDAEWWKPSDDPIRNLVKAGALLAAEIDRLKRKQTTEEK